MIKQYNIIDAVFLLMITISGSIIFGSLDQKKRDFFVDNLLFRNLLVFSLIFFLSNSLTTSTHEPVNELINTFYIWIMFIVFIKLDQWFVVMGILMLIIYYILSVAIDFKDNEYEQKKNQKKQEQEEQQEQEGVEDNEESEYQQYREKLAHTQRIIVNSMIGITGIGYLIHLNGLYEKGHVELSDFF
jgi:predicted membrane protein